MAKLRIRAGETLTGAWSHISRRVVMPGGLNVGDPTKMRAGDTKPLQELVALRGSQMQQMRGRQLFNAVLGESALLDVATRGDSFQDIWSPSGQLTRTTLKCTIAQFERLLELAPRDWVNATFPDGQAQIQAAEKSARQDKVSENLIKKAEMTCVSSRQWAEMATLLGMKVYFGGARCFVHPDYLRSDYLSPEFRGNVVGAGFAE